MTRPTTLLLATTNAGKVAELADAVAGAGCFRVLGLGDMGKAPEVVENETTFAGNARLKAEAYATHFGVKCLADDSGLCVDAIAGAPGIHSARYAGLGATDETNWRKLLTELAGVSERSAHFVCALAYATPGASTEVFEGKCAGVITNAPRGTYGFGYDCVFQPLGSALTLAEVQPEEKRRISHRAKALAAWLATLNAEPNVDVKGT